MVGKASIISTGEPDSFTPGVEFRVRPTITNVGGDGMLWVHLIDRYTGAFLAGEEIYVSSGQNWVPSLYVTLTQTTDFHGRLQAGYREGWVITDSKNFTIPVAEVSCTASFQETSVEVGATIHANFTWSNAVYRGFPYYHYAVMNIKDPNGGICAQHFELTNSSGSKSLSCVTDMAGTWTCKIEVWQGVFYVPCTDTVSVTEPSPPPTVSFSAYPTTIERGQSSRLTWSTNYATSVKINNVSKPLSGSEYVYPTTTTTYTLVATGDGGTTTKSVTVTVTEPSPSCTASFQETSAKVGDTIHANFTWSNALKRGYPYYHYAVMWIEDPNGDSGINHFELSNATGSKTLEFKTDMIGTWKCQIDVWQGVYYISCTDTVSILGGIGGIHSDTVFKYGPFNTGTAVNVIDPLVISNIGNEYGLINWAIYEEGNPTPLVSDSIGLNGGTYFDLGAIPLTTPDTAGDWKLCLTVWSTLETEPTCAYLTLDIRNFY